MRYLFLRKKSDENANDVSGNETYACFQGATSNRFLKTDLVDFLRWKWNFVENWVRHCPLHLIRSYHVLHYSSVFQFFEFVLLLVSTIFSVHCLYFSEIKL